jgi:hypothetical protein
MSEPVKIIVTASTAEAAAALQQFVQQAGSGLKSLVPAGAAGASALKQTREAALLTHEGFRTLSSTAYLLGGTRFPELGMGVMGVTQGLRALRTTSLLTGASMSTMLPVLGGIAAVVGAGALLWGAFRSEEERTIAENNKLTESFKAMPEIIKQINAAAKSGVLSPEDQSRLLQNIGVVRGVADFAKLYTAPQNPTVNAQQTDHISTSFLGIPDATDIKRTNEELVKMGILLKEVNPKDQTVTYSVNPQIEAMDKIAELQKKLTVEALIGFDKERAAAKLKYDDELQALNEYIEIASSKLDAQKGGALRGELASAYQTQLDAIAKKQSDEAARQQAEGAAKIKETFAKDVADQEKELERQITLSQAGESEERNKNFEREYQQRIFLAQQFLYSGELDEKEYTDLVTEATIKRLDAEKKYNAELQKEAALQQQINRATTEAQLKGVQDNPLLTEQQKQQQSVPLYQQQLTDSQSDIAGLQNQKSSTADKTEQLELEKRISDEKLKQVGIERQLFLAQNANNLGVQLGLIVTKLQNIGTLAQQTATILGGAFTTATNSISSNISKVIEGTETWRKAMLEISRSVVNELIQGFVHMAVQWILQHTVMAVVSRLFHTTDAALATDAAGTKATVSVASATTQVGANTAVAGSGAASSQASIPYVGPYLALIEMAAVIAAIGASCSSFAAGGYTGDGGQYETAGFVHRGEFVFNQSAVNRIGVDNLAALHQGGIRAPASGMANGDSSKNGPTIHIVNAYSDQDVLNIIKGSRAEHIVVNHVFKNRLRVGIKTG